MTELTKLPEKWCVKITEENKDILTKWKTQNNSTVEKAGEYGSSYVNYKGLNCIGKGDKTEITFEQFKKWVLKEETKSLVGRYLKALKHRPIGTNYVKGDYIKIMEDNLKGSVKCEKNYTFGWDSYNWVRCSLVLMPEGFDPNTETTTKFEVGKWYEFDNPYFKDKVYAKFLKEEIHIGGYYIWVFSEYIGCDKYMKFEGFLDSNRCTKKLTDLSEIQQYLPDNHPDKVKSTIIPETWYCKPENEKEAKILAKYFDDNQCGGYKCVYSNIIEKCIKFGLSNCGYGLSKKSDATEITFDFFKTHILKNIETTISECVDTLLEEAKIRYPIGTTIENLSDNSIYTINSYDFGVFENKTIVNKLYKNFCYTLITIYKDGNWAKIISLPKNIVFPNISDIDPVSIPEEIKTTDELISNKLEIYTNPIKPIEVNRPIELKFKTVKSLTIK